MYVCMHACMYVCMYVSVFSMYVRMHVYMCVCMYICTYVRMYVCMYVCVAKMTARRWGGMSIVTIITVTASSSHIIHSSTDLYGHRLLKLIYALMYVNLNAWLLLFCHKVCLICFRYY